MRGRAGRSAGQPGSASTAAIPFIGGLDTPILQLSDHTQDQWTLRHAVEGVHIFGGTGSGKTSGSGRSLALSYLRMGMGGIVLTAKPGEWELWQDYARETGRTAHLIRFDASGRYRFNFLDYQAHVSTDESGRLITSNIVDLISHVAQAAQRGNGMQGQGAEQPFWRLAPRELISHSIDALWNATGHLSLSEIVEFILSAPKTQEEFASDEAVEKSFCLRTLRSLLTAPRYPMNRHDLDVVMQFFYRNFAVLDQRTRSNIVVTMTSQLAPLLKGTMRELFATRTNLVPELTHEGAIIVLDLPVKTYQEAGLLAQHIFKYQWQVATERRAVRSEVRPVFCWADEAQFFITPYDIQFQTTARSSRACTVYLTQTVSNYFAMIGGQNSRDATMAFLANFVTKIFHNNADRNTNEMAAEMIGRNIQVRRSDARGLSTSEGSNRGTTRGSSRSYGTSSSGGGSSASDQVGINDGSSYGLSFTSGLSLNETTSEQMDLDIQPGEFATIRTGGPENGFRSDAVIFQSGRRFAGNRGKNYLTVSFPQRTG